MIMEEQQKKISRTIRASHLPTTSSRRDLEELFSDVGSVKKCFLVRNEKTGEFNGAAYITFAEADDATKAVEKFNNYMMENNPIHVKFSKRREHDTDSDKPFVIKTLNNEEKDDKKSMKREYFNKEESKLMKEKARERKGRLIVRNLSFQANEKSIKKHFAAYGNITEVNVLKKKDGKMVGCAFIQYDTSEAAYKAIQVCHGKEHLGRPLSVDLAMPKYKYEKASVKQEPMDVDEIKLEDDSHFSEQQSSPVKTEIKEEPLSSSDDSEDKEEEEEDDEPAVKSPKKSNIKVEHNKSKPIGPSKDVTEGRTIFVSNVSFSTTEEELTEILSKFGKLKYVLICIDKLTEHPKGTAFAQFINRDSADECLKAFEDPSQQDQFFVGGRTIRLSRAMSREQLNKQKDENKNKDKFKDKRNLYLAREGLIRQGTLASKELSSSDQQLRSARERYKRNLLKNLHIYVSPKRLCIHNIPESWTDKQLRDLFIKNSTKGVKVTEARIMRDLKNLDENGNGKSKGFGFVTFNDHDCALASLRAINNNPAIWNKNKRPIVEFSLENRKAVKARDNRQVKSKVNNPNNKAFTDKPELKKQLDSNESKGFMGAKSQPKTKGKIGLPTHTGPKIRHRNKISRNQLRRDSAKIHGKKRNRNQKNSDNPAKRKKLNNND